MATEVGARLRQARERRGLTLKDVADTTKISVPALKAIESNDFARLPGGVFRRAYLRAFASAVELDGRQIAQDYVAAFEPDPPGDVF